MFLTKSARNNRVVVRFHSRGVHHDDDNSVCAGGNELTDRIAAFAISIQNVSHIQAKPTSTMRSISNRGVGVIYLDNCHGMR